MNKIKVIEKPEIVVHGTADKPYYEIKYLEEGKDDYNIGYSSYDLNNCFQWLEDEFEVVERTPGEIAGYALRKILCKLEKLSSDEEIIKDHDNKGYINFAVDFDGVLCKSAYPEIGEPNMKMMAYLMKRKALGDNVILWTARTGEELQAAIDWCAAYGLQFDYVNEGDPIVENMYGTPGKPTRKIYADVYIDDRNMVPSDIWSVQCNECDEVKEANAQKEKETVHKASHYQKGVFEVIDEMIIAFGADAAIQFCRLNAWKYRARAAYKDNEEEDMMKADEYLKMAHEIMKRRRGPLGMLKDDSLCLIGDRE